MKKLILALILTLAISGLAVAAVNNIKVSGDITAQAITRDLSLGENSIAAKDSEDFLLSQVRLRFDADLSENVAAVVQLINERVWGDEGSTDTDIDLDLAYVTMKEFIYAPLTLTVGRQNLRFGKGLIVGDPDTDNNVAATGSNLSNIADDLSLRKAFDAIRSTLEYTLADKPLILDIIYAKVEENNTDQEDDVTLWGGNANYKLSDKVTGEMYFFAKDQDRVLVTEDENDVVYAIGLRGDIQATEKLGIYGEYARQFGDRAEAATNHSHVEAFAVQVGGDYKFMDEKNSLMGLSYTYLSGDKDTGDNSYKAWNPMFEDQRVGEIANILFDNTNMWYIKLNASTMPREDITAGLDIYYLKLAQLDSDALSGNGIITVGNEQEFGNKELGWEFDASLKYDYTEDVQLGLIGGWFVPGSHFADSNDNTAYSIRGTCSVNF